LYPLEAARREVASGTLGLEMLEGMVDWLACMFEEALDLETLE
jgi:hypothetical protein